MRVTVRPEYAGDQELRVRELLAEHAHERNGAAFAPRRCALSEEFLRRGVDRFLQPRLHFRYFPPTGALLRLERDPRAVRRIAFEEVLQLAVEIRGIERRWDTQ